MGFIQRCRCPRREKRSQARKLIDLDTDPSQAKRLERQQKALNHANTFEAVARECHTLNLETWTERHGKNVLHRLSEDVFPLLGSRPIADIEAPELLDTLRQVEKRDALEIAKRLWQTCGQVFRYAIATGRAKRNPVPDLRDALKPVIAGQHAALDSKDLPEFIRALDLNETRLFPLTRLAIRLMMLTFVRTGELIGAIPVFAKDHRWRCMKWTMCDGWNSQCYRRLHCRMRQAHRKGKDTE